MMSIAYDYSHETAPDAREEFVMAELAPFTSHLGRYRRPAYRGTCTSMYVAIIAISEDEIDIRRKIEFAAAELAHAEYR